MLTVTLGSIEQKFSLPMDFIRAALPDSILASALEDPTCATLRLTNPAVTPEVMTLLVDLSQGKEPTKHQPNILAVHRYLNIPQVCGYADPLYDRLVGCSALIAQAIYQKALREDRHHLFAYLTQKGHPPTEYDFVTAAEMGAVKILQLMLTSLLTHHPFMDLPMGRSTEKKDDVTTPRTAKGRLPSSFGRKLNTVTPTLLQYTVLAAVENNRPEVLRMLAVSNIRSLYLQTITRRLLEVAIQSGHLEVCRLLFPEARFEVRPWDSLLDYALDNEEPDWNIVVLLLQRPEISPPLLRDALVEASMHGRREIVSMILGDKRFDSRLVTWSYPDADRGLLWATLKNGHADIVLQFLQDERVGLPNSPLALQGLCQYALLKGYLELATFLLTDRRLQLTAPVTWEAYDKTWEEYSSDDEPESEAQHSSLSAQNWESHDAESGEDQT